MERVCKNCGYYGTSVATIGYFHCAFRRTSFTLQGRDWLSCTAFREKEKFEEQICFTCKHLIANQEMRLWQCVLNPAERNRRMTKAAATKVGCKDWNWKVASKENVCHNCSHHRMGFFPYCDVLTREEADVIEVNAIPCNRFEERT